MKRTQSTINRKRNREASEEFERSGEEDEKRRLTTKSTMNTEPEVEALNTIFASSSSSLMASENLMFALLVLRFDFVTWVFNGKETAKFIYVAKETNMREKTMGEREYHSFQVKIKVIEAVTNHKARNPCSQLV